MMELPKRIGRSVLPSSLNTVLGDLICHPWVGRRIGRVFRERVPARGVVIATDSEVVNDRTKAQIFWGIYESAEIRFVKGHLRSDLDVVELGSSLGVVSSHIAIALKPEARLVCVEANPELIPIIKANTLANAAGAKVTILQRAIDYDPGRRQVLLQVSDNTAASRVSPESVSVADSVEVPTARLADVLKAQEIGRYALVADIEGAEAGILLNDAEALESCEQIIIELHDTHYEGREYCYGDLAEMIQNRHGFRAEAQHGPVYAFSR